MDLFRARVGKTTTEISSLMCDLSAPHVGSRDNASAV